MADSNDLRREGPAPLPRTEQAIEDLVLACLDTSDPVAELVRRTADRPHLRVKARRVLERVLLEEDLDPPTGQDRSS